MSQTTPPTITAAPAPPIRGTSTFKTLVDAFLTWMAAAVAQFQALGTNVYNNAVDCFNNAAAAAASASAAGGSATAAASSAGAVVWVSGATVALGATVLSPADLYRPYRRITATGSGATDPKNDSTNYTATIIGTFPYLHVREEQTSGTAGGTSTSATQHVRVLNTTVGTNSITGASLASNIVTLPAGTYEFRADAPCLNGTQHKISLYNDSDSTDILVGVSVSSASGAGASVPAICSGRFTLATAKNIKLRHYIYTGLVTSGLGLAVGSGSVEVYASLQIWKVA
jgi:hypothetical protein